MKTTTKATLAIGLALVGVFNVHKGTKVVKNLTAPFPPEPVLDTGQSIIRSNRFSTNIIITPRVYLLPIVQLPTNFSWANFYSWKMLSSTNFGSTWQLYSNWSFQVRYNQTIFQSNRLTGVITPVFTNNWTNVLVVPLEHTTSRFFKMTL